MTDQNHRPLLEKNDASFVRSDLLESIRAASVANTKLKYRLENRLWLEEKRYTLMIDPQRDAAGHSGRVMPLPPGGLITAKRKFESGDAMGNDLLREQLRAVFEKWGIKQPEIIGTTEGVWISNKSLDDLAVLTKTYATGDNPHAGAKLFVRLCERYGREAERGGRG